MDKVRFGILGTAKIARTKVVPGTQRAPNCEVVAVASREASRARRVAAGLGVPRSHGSYQALVDDPGVDAVYIPLPNDLHAEWAIRAAAAGKHVLCEKPLAMSAKQAREMAAAADAAGIVLAEAFM